MKILYLYYRTQKNENVFSNEEIELGCPAFDVQMMILSSSANTPLMIATDIYPRLQLSYTKD